MFGIKLTTFVMLHFVPSPWLCVRVTGYRDSKSHDRSIAPDRVAVTAYFALAKSGEIKRLKTGKKKIYLTFPP